MAGAPREALPGLRGPLKGPPPEKAVGIFSTGFLISNDVSGQKISGRTTGRGGFIGGGGTILAFVNRLYTAFCTGYKAAVTLETWILVLVALGLVCGLLRLLVELRYLKVTHGLFTRAAETAALAALEARKSAPDGLERDSVLGDVHGEGPARLDTRSQASDIGEIRLAALLGGQGASFGHSGGAPEELATLDWSDHVGKRPKPADSEDLPTTEKRPCAACLKTRAALQKIAHAIRGSALTLGGRSHSKIADPKTVSDDLERTFVRQKRAETEKSALLERAETNRSRFDRPEMRSVGLKKGS